MSSIKRFMGAQFQTDTATNKLREGAGVGAALTGPGGLVGLAAKKYLVKGDDSTAKKLLVGLGVGVLTAGTGLPSYLLATAGQEKKDVAQTRADVVSNRYGNDAIDVTPRAVGQQRRPAIEGPRQGQIEGPPSRPALPPPGDNPLAAFLNPRPRAPLDPVAMKVARGDD